MKLKETFVGFLLKISVLAMSLRMLSMLPIRDLDLTGVHGGGL